MVLHRLNLQMGSIRIETAQPAGGGLLNMTMLVAMAAGPWTQILARHEKQLVKRPIDSYNYHGQGAHAQCAWPLQLSSACDRRPDYSIVQDHWFNEVIILTSLAWRSLTSPRSWQQLLAELGSELPTRDRVDVRKLPHVNFKKRQKKLFYRTAKLKTDRLQIAVS